MDITIEPQGVFVSKSGQLEAILPSGLYFFPHPSNEDYIVYSRSFTARDDFYNISVSGLQSVNGVLFSGTREELVDHISKLSTLNTAKKGTSLNPFLTVQELYTYKPQDGRYYFAIDGKSFKADVQKKGALFWVLALQYHHEGGTNPDLNVIPIGKDLPKFDDSPLGTDNSGDLAKFGHASQLFFDLLANERLALRWQGSTSNHSRIMDFYTPIFGSVQSDTGSYDGMQNSFVTFAEHTAFMPASITNVDGTPSAGDLSLTRLPYWDSPNQLYWNIKGDGVWWEMDDMTDSADFDTIHRVWATVLPKARIFNAGDLAGVFNDFNPFPQGDPVENWDVLQIACPTIAVGLRGIEAPTDRQYHELTIMNIGTAARINLAPLNSDSQPQNQFASRATIALGRGESLLVAYYPELQKWIPRTNSN